MKRMYKIFCTTENGTRECGNGHVMRTEAEKIADELNKKEDGVTYFVRGVFDVR